MKILIVSPAPRESTLGNAATARRWERVFLDLGHEVQIREGWPGTSLPGTSLPGTSLPGEGLPLQGCDLLLALHARRSHSSVRAFAEACPGKPLVVALTGTDLYQDLPANAEARESLRLATALVLLQEDGLGYLPESARAKAVVIPQSARPSSRAPRKSEEAFDVCVLAHLREIKDPLLAARAARLLPEESRIRILHAGRVIEEDYASMAAREMEENVRYHWLGELDPEAAKERLAGSQLLVSTSHMEGGANVISEALVCEVPVLATRISGSLGSLGKDYPGFYPVGDAQALADLLLRAERDPGFLALLLAAVEPILPCLRPEAEREAWKRVFEEIEQA